MQEKKGHKCILLLIVITTLLLLFKVYLANETYYISRDIQKITAKSNALKEERNILQLKIEKLRYKNTISDPLFSYESKETVVETDNKTDSKTPKELFNSISNKDSN